MERVRDLPRIPPRAPDAHKGDFGRVLIVAGSSEMPGAAVLAARAALRTGSGLVTCAVPSAVGTALGAAAPEATQIHIGDTRPSPPLVAALAELIPRFDAVAVGPGLGTLSGARELVVVVLSSCAKPLVLDADALNIIAAHPETAGAPSPARVWTPHPGELERLTGERPRSPEERAAAAARFAAGRGGVCVLKGRGTVVADGVRLFVNETGNPGMATAGSGDVLTGVIASLLGQGLAPFEAACLGVHLHGLAGDLAAAALGEASVIAGDMIGRLPEAIRRHGGRP
ncbi:MAG: NAD(P)H-hydrate dehydratase [Planctomycetes bacterium]|nr:NAD(P)H-hydrate dehydratase [Planctomycetota bacterium]